VAFDFDSLAIDTMSADGLDALPVAVIKLDSAKRVLFLNRAAEALLGLSRDGAADGDVFAALQPENLPTRLDERFEEGVRRGRFGPAERQVLCLAGYVAPALVDMRPASGSGGVWLLLQPELRSSNRLPNAIQPHGAFLAIDRLSGMVKAASANVAAIMGKPECDLVGMPLSTLLPPELATAILALSDDVPDEPGAADALQFDPGDGLPRLAAQIHRIGSLIQIELEQAATGFAGGMISNARNWVLRETARLHKLGQSEAVLTEATTAIRRFTGMERILIYRYNSNLNGSVIAEDRPGTVEGGLAGQGFQAPLPSSAKSDHLLSSAIYHIANVDAVPVEVRFSPDVQDIAGAMLDTTRLRAPDPTLCDQLRAMGAIASFSVPVLRQGEPWGLVIGHARQPRIVTSERLDAVAVLAGSLVDRFEATLSGQVAEDQTRRQVVLNRILKQIASEDTILRGLTAGQDTVLDLFKDVSGAVLELAGQRVCVGQTPPEEVMDELIQRLAREIEDDVWASDCLSERFPAFQAYAEGASGALALFFGPTRQDVIVWLRPGRFGRRAVPDNILKERRVRTDLLTDPHTAEDGRRLIRSEAWTDLSIELAHNLRYSVMEVIATQAERLQRANMALEHSNRVKTDFLSMMSHELRTPLNAILGFAQLIQSQIGRPNANDRIAGYAETIEQAGRHLLSLINDILQYARLDAGRGDLALGPCPLRESVEQSVAILAPLADQKSIDIVTSVPDGEVVARGDKRAIEQVLINLLANAVKYSGGNRIDLTIRHLASQMEIEVADNGAGFPRFVLSNRFQPFLQEDPQVSRPHEGTGLGLALCKLLIDQMQGSIELDNRPRGGARVTVTLPAWRSKARGEELFG